MLKSWMITGLLLGSFSGLSLYAAGSIKTFESDGCSMFPEGGIQDGKLWCSCCLVHDLRYWVGGSKAKRKNADLELKDCVERKTGNPVLAQTMYLGVRAGGKPSLPTWYRWGYGYKFGRGYTEPNFQEWLEIREKVEEFESSNHSLDVCKEVLMAPTDLFSVLIEDREEISTRIANSNDDN